MEKSQAVEFFTKIEEHECPSKPAELSTEKLQDALAGVADILDDFGLHNHNIATVGDAGWFRLRDLLIAVHDRLGDSKPL